MEKELAKIKSADVGYEDHGCPFLDLQFDYDSGSSQGLGYVVNMAFILRLLDAVGVSWVSELIGKSCWVTHDHSSITVIEPLHKKDGKTFVIKEWSEWTKKYCSHSASQMRGE